MEAADEKLIKEIEKDEEIMKIEYEEKREELEEERVMAAEGEEVISLRVTSWVANGKTMTGVVVINEDDDYDDYGTRNKSGDMDIVCPICFRLLATFGDHRICCLPCGHMYGMSCVNNWLQQRQSSQRCPQCNTLCTLKDVRVLYPACPDPTLHKASTTHFPFNKQGFNAFEEYVTQRWHDTMQLCLDTSDRELVLAERCRDTLKRRDDAAGRQLKAKKRRRDAFVPRHADALEQLVVDLERRIDALGRVAIELERRFRALGQRAATLRCQADAWKASMNFFKQRYKEHMGSARQKTKHWS